MRHLACTGVPLSRSVPETAYHAETRGVLEACMGDDVYLLIDRAVLWVCLASACMCVFREWFFLSRLTCCSVIFYNLHSSDLSLLFSICVVVFVNSVATNARRDVMDRRRKGDGSVVTRGLCTS